MLKQQTGRAPSIGKAILSGSTTALVAALLGTALLAKLLDTEMLKMENAGYGIMVIHLLSVFLGAKGALAVGGREGQVAAGITGGLYYLCLLMVNGLFFGGSFHGLGVTLLLTILATLGAILTAGKWYGNSKRRRYKIPK